MSTINKLDLTHRTAKHNRRDLTRGLKQVIPRLPVHAQVTAAATAASLEYVRRDPNLTGDEKQELFTSIVNNLQEGSSPPAQQEAA